MHAGEKRMNHRQRVPALIYIRDTRTSERRPPAGQPFRGEHTAVLFATMGGGAGGEVGG